MIPHGTYSKYANDDCHCAACRKAWSEYTLQRRVKRYAWTAVNGLPSSVEHGEPAYFNWGCHCDICVGDARAKGRVRRARYRARLAAAP
jgi:hypothetical protein